MNQVFFYFLMLVTWDPTGPNETMVASRTVVASTEDSSANCMAVGEKLVRETTAKDKKLQAKYFCLPYISPEEADAALKSL